MIYVRGIRINVKEDLKKQKIYIMFAHIIRENDGCAALLLQQAFYINLCALVKSHIFPLVRNMHLVCNDHMV